MKNLVLTIVFLLSIVVHQWNAAAQVDSVLVTLFNDAIDYQMSSQGDKGVGVAVVMPDGQLWWGQKGIDQYGQPLTDTTLFFTASLTKTMVAACVLQLVEEGLIQLDSPYTHYLSAIPYVDTMSTIRQLLNQTAGVHEFQKNPAWANELFSGISLAPGEVLERYLDQPNDFPPGTSWAYSSSNYVVLGLVIEKVTGATLHENLRTRFFTPLGLNHTWCGGFETFPGPDAGMWNMAGGVLVDFSSMPRTTLLTQGFAVGYVVSTPHDMALWAKALYKDRNILTADSYAEMFTIAPQSEGFWGPGWGYGLGMFRLPVNANQQLYGFGHSGILIHQSNMYWDEEKNFIVVTMTNSASQNGNLAFQSIYFPLRSQLTNLASEIYVNDLILYPNPATGEVRLEGYVEAGSDLIVTDLIGKVVFQERIKSSTEQIRLDISNWEPSTYWVWIQMPNGQIGRGKFIKVL